MSFVIDLKLASTLRTHLEEQGYTFTQPPYTLFSAKKPGLSVTLYTSGKLLVQGKDKEDFIKYYLEPELLGTFQFPSPHIGVDESGKGDFFGPLCIAGVFADETMLQSLIKHGVRDSKTIKDTTIKTLAPIIQSICPHECIILYPKKYNELYTNFGNLNALLAWGHATVIEQLHKKTGCKEAHIDQFASEHVVEKALARKNIAISLSQSHRGESDPVIAAASILARNAFITGLQTLSNTYHIELPKGAGSPVLLAGKRFLCAHNKEALAQVAKMHFKTAQEILQSADYKMNENQ